MFSPEIVYQNFSYAIQIQHWPLWCLSSPPWFHPFSSPLPSSNSFLMGLSASRVLLSHPILHTSARKLFLQSESDHVSSMCQTFEWHPMVYRIKQTPEKCGLTTIFLVVLLPFQDLCLISIVSPGWESALSLSHNLPILSLCLKYCLPSPAVSLPGASSLSRDPGKCHLPAKTFPNCLPTTAFCHLSFPSHFFFKSAKSFSLFVQNHILSE